ncbi:MAG: PEGA domain-containing protein [Myxococcota bacterium]
MNRAAAVRVAVALALVGLAADGAVAAEAEDAAAVADPGPRAMERGVAFARVGGYTKALLWFERALPTMSGGSDVFYNLTTTSEALKDYKRVHLYARGFLAREPAGADADAFRARVAEAARKLKAAGMAPVPVQFALEPAGLEVRVEHAPLGVTGGDAIPLAPGRYAVEVTAPGYEPWRLALEVGSKPQTVAGVLTRRVSHGHLVVETKPAAGVSVFVDERLVGKTPLAAPVRLETGRVLVRFELDGYDLWSRYVEIRDGQTETLRPTLEKRRGP